MLPSPARSFFKGMLDLFAAEKTGELTTDALESFMTLHGLGGRAFGPRGDAGTLAAGGTRRIHKPSSSHALENRAFAERVTKPAGKRTEELYQRQVEQLEINKRNGRAYEQEQAELERLGGGEVGEQVTLVTKSGLRGRVDLLIRDLSTGKVSVVELKASMRALFSKKQKAFHEELSKGYSTIVGDGKPKFEGGLRLPPMSCIVRHKPEAE